MTAGQGLLTRLLRVETKRFRILLERGVTEDWFLLEEEKKAFSFIKKHLQKYGRVPSPEVVELEADVTIPALIPDESLEFWIDELILLRSLQEFERDLEKAKKLVKARNRDSAIACIQEIYRKQLSFTGVGSVSYLSAMQAPVLKEHSKNQQLLRSGTLPGIPYGLPYVDMITGGAQPGDSVIIIAKTGVGKTWMLLHSSIHAFLARHKVLLISMEMTKTQIARRLLSILGGVDTRALRFGRVSKFGLNALKTRLQEQLAGKADDDFVIVEGGLKRSYEDVLLLAQEIRPDAVYIDMAHLLSGGYLTKNMSGWERQAHVTENLKGIGLELGIPIIQTHHLSKGGEKEGAEGVGRAKAIAEVASVVFKLSAENTRAVSATYVRVKHCILDIVKGREGEFGCVRLAMDLQRGSITEAEVLLHGDMSEAGTAGEAQEGEDAEPA